MQGQQGGADTNRAWHYSGRLCTSLARRLRQNPLPASQEGRVETQGKQSFGRETQLWVHQEAEMQIQDIKAHPGTHKNLPAIQAVVEGSMSLHLPNSCCQNQIITHLPHPPTTAKNWKVQVEYSTKGGTR